MKKFQIKINTAWCKSCGICIEYCPKKVLAFDEDGKAAAISPEACVGCRLCEFRCPDYAVRVGGNDGD